MTTEAKGNGAVIVRSVLQPEQTGTVQDPSLGAGPATTGRGEDGARGEGSEAKRNRPITVKRFKVG